MDKVDFKNKVVYQIWPRSFKDGNGDGIGDIKGIREKLGYLSSLGIDYLWLSPVYASQNKDYGYDIDDYYAINPDFGTMEEFELLIDEAKGYGLGIIMDLVANHTSDQHVWFKQAVASEDSKYRDYYFFRKGKNGGAPNNWMSAFGGSAWTKEEGTDNYYLTMFTPNQCDLNWENEEVRKGIWDIMKFWLDKGVAGFRMDVINAISKTEGLPDAGKPGTKLAFPMEHIVSLPKSHDYLKEMYDEVIGKYGCIAIGEGMMTSLEELNKYTCPESHELDMMFQFDIALIGCGPLGKFDFRKMFYWNVKQLKELLAKWQEGTETGGGWIGNYLSNHDQPRQVSRFGDDKYYRRESAKALALMNMTLRGTPFIYQGEEIGMTNCELEEEDWRDFEAINDYKVLQSMMHLPAAISKKIIKKMTRDNARTPVQWDSTENAGFSESMPWIKVNPNYKQINVEDEEKRDDSLTKFYRELISFRKNSPELSYGSFELICMEHPSAIVYLREHEGKKKLVAINLSKKPCTVDIGESCMHKGHFVFGTHSQEKYSRRLELKPYEARIYQVNED